mgnify:CR=1 FL=1
MKNPIAEVGRPDSLDLVKPEDAPNEGEYFCPDKNCLDPERKLTLKTSTRNNKYFSHRPSCDHDISPAMLLHKMVIAHLKLMPSILLPKTGFFSQPKLFSINQEKSRIEYDPDMHSTPEVMLINDEEEMVYLDIIFDDELSEEKYRAAVQQNLPYLVLDLEEFYQDNQVNLVDVDFLQKAVPELLHDQHVKSWQFLPEHLRKINKNTTKGLITGALIGVAGIAGVFLFKSFKK